MAKVFLLRYALSFVLGLIISFGVLVALQAGQGSAILAIDFFALPMAAPLATLVFVPVARALMRRGRLGLVECAITAILAIMLGTAPILALFVGSGDSAGLFVLMLATNYGVTYGLPLGVLVWQNMAARQPPFFLKETPRPPGFLPYALASAAIVVLWQFPFWIAAGSF